VGPLQTWAGLSQRSVYAGASVFALALAALAFIIVHRAATAASPAAADAA
jgi:hypothetical protein